MRARTAIAAFLLTAPCALAAAETPALMPLPQRVEWKSGHFSLAPAVQIVADPGLGPTAHYLAARLPAGAVKERASGTISLSTRGADPRLGAEGYDLRVREGAVSIRARTPAGVFYGVQTFLQLLTPDKKKAPCVAIEDWPRFPWRGLMLDVSRHFYSKSEVERILDEMALFKLNTFHWHLTDDQGWRIEIRKYPKLTQVGAWRDKSALAYWKIQPDNLGKDNAHPAWAAPSADKFAADGRYGGYYTQDDIREVVAHAAVLHIAVIPEIEMPGHCVAALAAYPEYGCGGEAYSTNVGAGINRGVYCPGNEATFRFLDDVLGEVFALFPGRYVHIGGDEVSPEVKQGIWGKCPACQALMKREGLKNLEELQSWFIRRIEKFVNSRGKTLIGWSEILQGGLAANATVMDWIGGAAESASAGHDVVMTPTGFCYLDYYQSTRRAGEPHAAGRTLPLEKAYEFEPIPARLPPAFRSHILGGQANLWTEWVASLPHAEYMIFPRACALAEVVWSDPSARAWPDFQRRLAGEEKRLDALGIHYRPTDAAP